MRHIRQILPENKGIEDINETVRAALPQILEGHIPANMTDSPSKPGFKYHSSFDFNHTNVGTFGAVINWLIAEAEAQTVIELGCGSGILADFLPPATNYLGLDGNPDAGMFVKQMNQDNKHVIILDYTKDFILDPPPLADLMISFDFFEHLEEDRTDFVVQKTGELLRPGGLAFFIIDRLPLPEHINIKPYEWWDEKFRRIAGWTPWEKRDEFLEFYHKNKPPHWAQNTQWHNFMLYEG
jgi:SAM-dependent methyltransferase